VTVRTLGLTGLIFVVAGLVATVCFVWVELPVHRWGQMDAAACGTLALCLAGCVLCWRSSGVGRWVAVLGTPLVVIWLVKLVLFFACQIYVIDEEYGEEFPWSNYGSRLDSTGPSFSIGTVPSDSALLPSAVRSLRDSSVRFFFAVTLHAQRSTLYELGGGWPAR
jgi:hypothetical protein